MFKSIQFALRNSNTIRSSSRLLNNNNNGYLSGVNRFFTTEPNTADIKVPTTLIMELRKKSDAPLTDCKVALQNCELNVERAVKWLLEKGKARANKLQNRVSAEGIISVQVNNDTKSAVILEINSETDFVSRGETFRTLAKLITTSSLNNVSTIGKKSSVGCVPELEIDQIKSNKVVFGEDGEMTIDEALIRTISKLRENLILRRAAVIEPSNKSNVIVSGYAHDPQGTREIGRLGSIVKIEYEGECNDIAALKTLADQLAVHIVGVSPTVVGIQDIPQEMLDECAKNKKHPGSLYNEHCLLEQSFISSSDGDSVKQHIEKLAKKLNCTITVKGFKRYEVGQGIEKKVENYADEVMGKINASK
ncbi:hypothetical protein CYY_001472 [Polysphondylium violaceum]|uniref:Elongation factor Ts, mitochondrial n=1 Tax=Polysphondylium violaceum TaxID=133409 RepID=A0A8J4V452_9MYCE|nr:hypothetical protein CYY_001472 [Polysphondylium violaceum]